MKPNRDLTGMSRLVDSVGDLVSFIILNLCSLLSCSRSARMLFAVIRRRRLCMSRAPTTTIVSTFVRSNRRTGECADGRIDELATKSTDGVSMRFYVGAVYSLELFLFSVKITSRIIIIIKSMAHSGAWCNVLG